MLFLKPTIYKECPEGDSDDSFDASPSTSLLPVQVKAPPVPAAKMAKKGKKERTSLPFFKGKKGKNGAFPLLEQNKNQTVRTVYPEESNVS
jgi:hypothetical protein